MKLYFEQYKPSRFRNKSLTEKKLLNPYTQDWVDIIEYKGFEIEKLSENEYSVFYCGDDILFDSEEDAKEFIDENI